MANFKSEIAARVAAWFLPLPKDTLKERAVRKLGVAAELVRLGEAAKKKAKDELVALGIICPDSYAASTTGVMFDSERYVMTQSTKAGSTRLDPVSLNAALVAEGLSLAMQRRIIAASEKPTKPATSFSVEAK